MARELIYQMFFKPTMIVVTPAPASGVRFMRINVVYVDTLRINVALPDSL